MQKGIRIVTVSAETELREVYKLTHDTYVDRSIIIPQENGLWTNYPELDKREDTLIFLAKLEDEYLGSISMTRINKLEDCYNYSIFKDEYDAFWDPTVSCFSSWRLSTSGSSRMQMLLILKLMLEVHIHADIHNWKRVFFCFLPKHETLYKKIFPSGKVLGRNLKAKDGIKTELILFTYDSYPEGRAHLEKLVYQLESRMFKLAG